jgi:hypothetical protein
MLQNRHKYGTLTDTVSLLKPVLNAAMLIPYEKLCVQTFHHNGKLIPEQCSGEPNPLLQLAIDTNQMSRPSRNRPTPPT